MRAIFLGVEISLWEFLLIEDFLEHLWHVFGAEE
jgi:hypothetical protein